jgi:hypothetical protein
MEVPVSTASLMTRRPQFLLACLFAGSAVLVSSACNSTKPKEYNTPEASQARCTESHSANGACAAAEAAEE